LLGQHIFILRRGYSMTSSPVYSTAGKKIPIIGKPKS
jgi:hypothetical protein